MRKQAMGRRQARAIARVITGSEDVPEDILSSLQRSAAKDLSQMSLRSNHREHRRTDRRRGYHRKHGRAL